MRIPSYMFGILLPYRENFSLTNQCSYTQSMHGRNEKLHNNVNCKISLCITIFLCMPLNQNANTATRLVIYCIHVGNNDIY